MSTFNDIASLYRETSLVQASAGEKLIELLAVTDHADILDVGCGTGNLTAALATRTTGTVTGIDPSEAMIREASLAYPDSRIRFLVMDDATLSFREAFDVIYCNSAFQWFTNPSIFLENANKALRSQGRIGIQAPAKRNYCPAFLDAIETCRKTPEIRQVFSGFRTPWFMLETENEYTELFRKAGFKVTFCAIEEISSRKSIDKVFDIFSSGAKAGYLNPAFHDVPFPKGFEASFLEAIRHAFSLQADADGLIDLLFHRIFLIAER